MVRRQLITTKYVEQNRELHGRPGGFGGKGRKWIEPVVALLDRFHATSVLDYGCGQGTLAEELRELGRSELRIDEYDPAVFGKDEMPSCADLVVATDVLEHVEPDCLPAVLAHLRLLARKAVFLVVALEPANKILPDCRNAHLILESREWWMDRVTLAGFTLQGVQGLPFHRKYKPDLQAHKRWMAVGIPG